MFCLNMAMQSNQILIDKIAVEENKRIYLSKKKTDLNENSQASKIKKYIKIKIFL